MLTLISTWFSRAVVLLTLLTAWSASAFGQGGTAKEEAMPPAQQSGEVQQAEYYAAQVSSGVVLVAHGDLPSTGFEVRLKSLPITIWPPQYRLEITPPSGMVNPVIMPFWVAAHFSADKPVEAVIVHDRAGQHTVPVEHLPAQGTSAEKNGHCQTVVGQSKKPSFDEAVLDALGKLDFPYPDAMLRWRVRQIDGRYGGIAGIRELRVEIEAGTDEPSPQHRSAMAGAPDPGDKDSRRSNEPDVDSIALRSAYLVQPLALNVDGVQLDVHRIQLTGQIGRTGHLLLDGNTCELNSFGDPNGCTKKLYDPIEVRLAAFYEADPLNKNRLLGEAQSEKLGQKIRFVVPRGPQEASPRLIILSNGENQKPECVLTMEQLP